MQSGLRASTTVVHFKLLIWRGRIAGGRAKLNRRILALSQFLPSRSVSRADRTGKVTIYALLFSGAPRIQAGAATLMIDGNDFPDFWLGAVAWERGIQTRLMR